MRESSSPASSNSKVYSPRKREVTIKRGHNSNTYLTQQESLLCVYLPPSHLDGLNGRGRREEKREKEGLFISRHKSQILLSSLMPSALPPTLPRKILPLCVRLCSCLGKKMAHFIGTGVRGEGEEDVST